jgi:hypothetical protein
MPSKYSSGKNAIAQCDRCNFRYKLSQLKRLVIKTKNVNILVCKTCWEPDQPQLQLGMYPVSDPQAVRDPRPDSPSYYQSGLDGLQVEAGTGVSPEQTGVPLLGSRIIQWGWKPVGGASYFDAALTPNDLVAQGNVSSVTVTIT